MFWKIIWALVMVLNTFTQVEYATLWLVEPLHFLTSSLRRDSPLQPRETPAFPTMTSSLQNEDRNWLSGKLGSRLHMLKNCTRQKRNSLKPCATCTSLSHFLPGLISVNIYIYIYIYVSLNPAGKLQ